MRKITTLLFLLGITFMSAQEQGYFFGELETNAQYLQDDSGIGFESPDDKLRANSYLQLNYNYGKITAGLQYEAYLPSALLGYDPMLDGGNEVATYYVNYRDEKFDITAGYFYEQFGSGLILRAWEDRQLGINSAIRGIRTKAFVTKDLDVTVLYGEQRNGFSVSEGTIQAADANLNLSSLLQLNRLSITVAASFVSRYQTNSNNPNIPKTVNAYGGRVDFSYANFFGGIEAIAKDKDVIVNEGNISSPQLFDGTALLVNLGWSQRGMGINASFRRLENFSFYSDRYAEGNTYNQQMVNYIPALTKQQDYLLTNIYVYSAQPRLFTSSEAEKRAGEVGGQFDFFYTFNKETALGKYGTKIAANFSYWAGVDADFDLEAQVYEPKFIGKGPRYYQDFNIEIKNRWSSLWQSAITYQNVTIDKGAALGGPLGTQGDIKANIAVLDVTRRFEKGKSLRAEIQHLWTKNDRKNWTAAVLEYNFNSNFGIYATDSYNYGSDEKPHYYSFGGSYTKGNTRFSMNYGRQRGGLLCVGGVCRYVPENTGFSASLMVNF